MRWLLAAALVAACSGDDDGAVKQGAAPQATQQRAEVDARTREFTRAKTALGDSLRHVKLEAPPATSIPCAEERFKDWGFDQRKLYLLDVTHVAELVGGKTDAPRGFTEDDARFLTDGMTDEVHAAGGMIGELDAMARSALVGIVRPGEVTLPSLEGGKLVPGVGRGWLMIHERASGSVLCAAPYEARSSEKITVTRLPNKRDMTPEAQEKLEQQTAAIADFKRQHRAAYVAALKSVSSRLVLAHQE